MAEYPRGSEWRRWDLHTHTPGTVKNDCFAGGASIDARWDQFYSDIVTYIGDGTDAAKAVVALGITDYLSIENYQRVVAEKRLPDSIKLLLPNVEMRIQPTANDSPINIHFLFDPAFSSAIESRFFSKLSFSYADTNFSAEKSELIRLGKTIDSSLSDEAAYKKGVEQFVPPLDAIKKVFEKVRNFVST